MPPPIPSWLQPNTAQRQTCLESELLLPVGTDALELDHETIRLVQAAGPKATIPVSEALVLQLSRSRGEQSWLDRLRGRERHQIHLHLRKSNTSRTAITLCGNVAEEKVEGLPWLDLGGQEVTGDVIQSVCHWIVARDIRPARWSAEDAIDPVQRSTHDLDEAVEEYRGQTGHTLRSLFTTIAVLALLELTLLLVGSLAAFLFTAAFYTAASTPVGQRAIATGAAALVTAGLCVWLSREKTFDWRLGITYVPFIGILVYMARVEHPAFLLKTSVLQQQPFDWYLTLLVGSLLSWYLIDWGMRKQTGRVDWINAEDPEAE